MASIKIIFSTALISLVTSCGSTRNSTAGLHSEESLSFDAFPERYRRVEECGVRGYAWRSDPICGAMYKEARSSSCEPESYREQASWRCPGGRKRSTYERQWSVQVSGNHIDLESYGCDASDHILYSFSDTLQSYDPLTDVKVYKVVRKCEIKEVAPRCRIPKFGIESWSRCRHESHGIETYYTCTHPSFGISNYNECPLRATRIELEQYLAMLRANIDTFAVKLLQHQAAFINDGASRQANGCLIKKYEDDPIFESIVSDLKTGFRNSFGEAFNPDEFDCSQTSPLPDAPSADCDRSQSRCSEYLAYAATKRWFEHHLQQLALLRDDVVARNNNEMRSTIDNMRTKLERSAL